MPLPFLIGDRWVEDTGQTILSYDPADGSLNAEVSAAGVHEVDTAVGAVQDAFDRSGWRERRPHERALVLYRIADAFMKRHHELARLQMKDNGKPLAECIGLVASAAATIRYYGAVCETREEQITPHAGSSSA